MKEPEGLRLSRFKDIMLCERACVNGGPMIYEITKGADRQHTRTHASNL